MLHPSSKTTAVAALYARSPGGGAVAVLPLAACGGGDGSGDDQGQQALQVRFAHGLASGDPLADRVMLWTRVTPPAGHEADIPVQWEIASDAAFATIVARGEPVLRRPGTSR